MIYHSSLELSVLKSRTNTTDVLNSAYDEALLNVDAPTCYHEVMAIILTFLLGRSSSTKTKGKRKLPNVVPEEPSSGSGVKKERIGKKVKG